MGTPSLPTTLIAQLYRRTAQYLRQVGYDAAVGDSDFYAGNTGISAQVALHRMAADHGNTAGMDDGEVKQLAEEITGRLGGILVASGELPWWTPRSSADALSFWECDLVKTDEWIPSLRTYRSRWHNIDDITRVFINAAVCFEAMSPGATVMFESETPHA